MSRANTGLNRQKKTGPNISDHKNYGVADDWKLYEVARAVTAAPFFFNAVEKQLSVNGSPGEIYSFTDGGFGPTNNPTVEGVREIEELYGDDSIATVVSIGTARADKPYGKGVLQFVKNITDLATNPEFNHNAMERDVAQGTKDFRYFRFNHHGELKVDMDEWKPHGRLAKEKGCKTLDKLHQGFQAWMAVRQNQLAIEECAAALVYWRRERAMWRSEWEGYATGVEYQCRHDCPSATINHRERFTEHLRRRHCTGWDDQRIEEEVNNCRTRWRYRPPD